MLDPAGTALEIGQSRAMELNITLVQPTAGSTVGIDMLCTRNAAGHGSSNGNSAGVGDGGGGSVGKGVGVDCEEGIDGEECSKLVVNGTSRRITIDLSRSTVGSVGTRAPVVAPFPSNLCATKLNPTVTSAMPCKSRHSLCI